MTICGVAREGMNERLNEARELFVLARRGREEGNPLRQHTSSDLTLQGMMYIPLYAALEYAVTHGTQCFLNYLSSLSVSTKHLERTLLALACDSEMSALQGLGERKKWAARRALVERIDDATPPVIGSTVFGAFLHNVYPKTVEEIFFCFGIESSPTSHPSHLGYFTEITEKRNAVAHGRESAKEVARGVTVQEMETRLNVAYEIGSHFLENIDHHADSLKFVRPRYRKSYRN